jgi:hypothetical protein
MAAIAGETVADTIYAIDAVTDDALLGWFESEWPDVELVSEGLDEAVLVGRDPTASTAPAASCTASGRPGPSPPPRPEAAASPTSAWRP